MLITDYSTLLVASIVTDHRRYGHLQQTIDARTINLEYWTITSFSHHANE